jgi:hypothetical protein
MLSRYSCVIEDIAVIYEEIDDSTVYPVTADLVER